MEHSTSTSSRVTRQTPQKLLENARKRACEKIESCFLVQVNYRSQFDLAWDNLHKTTDMVFQIVTDFNSYNQKSGLKIITKVLTLDKEEKEKRRIFKVDETNLSLDHSNVLHVQALRQLQQLMTNTHRTETMINSIKSRLNNSTNPMTLEELENIVYPEYSWAENNYHPNFFDFDDQVADLMTDLDGKKKILEKGISDLFSGNENASTTTASTSSGSDLVPSTSQGLAK